VTHEPILTRPVFAVDGEGRTWGDVVAAARDWGVWGAVVRAVTAPAKDPPDKAEVSRRVEERATEFRYARGLLTVDETHEWFAHWGISVNDWLAHERRRLTGEPAPDTGAAVWIEAVASGILPQTAHRLAAALAVHRALGGSGRPSIAELDAALECFAEGAATPERLPAVIAEHRLDWTSLDLATVELATQDAAREFLYGVREDGRPLEALAADSETPVTRSSVQIADLPPDLRSRLSSAGTGEVVGPLASDGIHRIVAVLNRRAPSPSDPVVAQRARVVLAERAVRREVARRIRWLDPVATSPTGA
jgi:hypothetical protein